MAPVGIPPNSVGHNFGQDCNRRYPLLVAQAGTTHLAALSWLKAWEDPHACLSPPLSFPQRSSHSVVQSRGPDGMAVGLPTERGCGCCQAQGWCPETLLVKARGQQGWKILVETLIIDPSACVCVYMYVHICVYAYVSVCICMWCVNVCVCVRTHVCFEKQFFPQVQAHLSGFCSISISKAFSISKVRQALSWHGFGCLEIILVICWLVFLFLKELIPLLFL